jgi:hypothetical protein
MSEAEKALFSVCTKLGPTSDSFSPTFTKGRKNNKTPAPPVEGLDTRLIWRLYESIYRGTHRNSHGGATIAKDPEPSA